VRPSDSWSKFKSVGPKGGLNRWLAPLIALAALLYLLWPLRHGMRGWNDFAFIYAAGRSWIHGHSPYDIPQYREEWIAVRPIFWNQDEGIAPTQPFFYPPHWIAFASAVAVLPWSLAARTWDCVNALSFLGLCAFSLRLAAPHLRATKERTLFVCLTIACVNGAVRYSFFNSQMSLLPTCAVVGAFWAARRGFPFWLALFTFLASMKPQIAFLPLAYLLFNGGARGVLTGGLGVALLSSVTILRVGPRLLLRQLGNCYAGHLKLAFNDLDRFTSVSSLFAAHGLAQIAKFLSPLIGLAAVLALTVWRTRSSNRALHSPLWEVSLCLALSAAFVPLHDYDLGLYTPLFVLLAEVRERVQAVFIAVLTFTACRVPALESWTGVHTLGPYLTLAVALVLSLLVWKGEGSAWQVSNSKEEGGREQNGRASDLPLRL
jgi:hypothetical protein